MLIGTFSVLKSNRKEVRVITDVKYIKKNIQSPEHLRESGTLLMKHINSELLHDAHSITAVVLECSHGHSFAEKSGWLKREDNLDI